VQPHDLRAVVPEQPHGGGVFAAAVEFLKHRVGEGRAAARMHERSRAPRSQFYTSPDVPFNGCARPLVDRGLGRFGAGASWGS
jgi:hypothetical protein